MKLKIEINMDNAAFEDNAEEEIRAILANVTPNMSKYSIIKLRDSNGNTVGHYEITED
jgi:hypothetical protein